jgi:hypothetical protein
MSRYGLHSLPDGWEASSVGWVERSETQQKGCCLEYRRARIEGGTYFFTVGTQ